MDVFILKLVLAPLLIGAATLVVRRWGYLLGGLFTGLPLTSGPVALFLALERGPAFAMKSSQGMLLGTITLVVFCMVFARTAKGLGWLTPTVAALGAYALTAWGLSFVSLDLVILALIVLLILWIALKALGPPASAGSIIAAPRWDLPFRMTIATATVLVITGGAEFLGPQWSGILAAFPAFTCIMAIFAQKQSGPPAARGLLRGNIIGYFSAVPFYVTVGLTVEHASIFLSFLAATVVCLAVNGLILLLILRGKADA